VFTQPENIVPESTKKEVSLDTSVSVQTLEDGTILRDVYLCSDDNESDFSVAFFRNNEETRTLKTLKVSFLDSNNEEIYLLVKEFTDLDLIMNPMIINQTIDTDLSNTVNIKYELIYE